MINLRLSLKNTAQFLALINYMLLEVCAFGAIDKN